MAEETLERRSRGDGFNRVTLLGRLAADPDVRLAVVKGEVGLHVARLRLAVNTSGEAEFFDLVAFGKAAQVLAEYGRKGRQVFVEGRLHNNEFSDKEGSKQKRTEVRVDEFQLLGPKPAAQ